MTISRREKIMQIWQAKFAAMREGVDGYETTWDYVLREPLTPDDYETIQGNTLSILDTDESVVVYETQHIRKAILVTVQIFIVADRDDPKSTELNRAIADVQRMFYSDIYTTDIDTKQYSLRLDELGSTKNIDFVGDFLLEAEITLEITYRHSTVDPRVC